MHWMIIQNLLNPFNIHNLFNVFILGIFYIDSPTTFNSKHQAPLKLKIYSQNSYHVNIPMKKMPHNSRHEIPSVNIYNLISH